MPSLDSRLTRVRVSAFSRETERVKMLFSTGESYLLVRSGFFRGYGFKVFDRAREVFQSRPDRLLAPRQYEIWSQNRSLGICKYVSRWSAQSHYEGKYDFDIRTENAAEYRARHCYRSGEDVPIGQAYVTQAYEVTNAMNLPVITATANCSAGELIIAAEASEYSQPAWLLPYVAARLFTDFVRSGCAAPD